MDDMNPLKMGGWIIWIHKRWVNGLLYPSNNEVVGGYIGFTPSVCPSVRLSRLPCPFCNIYSSGWILCILATNDHYHERVCRTQWPLTLTYIFKVIRPWLRKSCPLCSVYSSGWILFIFGTNDHYYKGVCRVLRFFQNLKIWIFSKFLKFFGLDLEKNLQFSMDSFHIWYKWSLVWDWSIVWTWDSKRTGQ